MKKITIYLILIFLSIQMTLAQKKVVLNSKYVTTLLYLKTNKAINQEIRLFHNRWLKKHKIKKNNCVDFNVSKFISYLPIPVFTSKIDFTKYTKDSLVRNSKIHREKYDFELEEIPYLRKLVPPTDTKLYLIFSKPIDNYLIAEFRIKDSKYEVDMSLLKTGPALHLMIFFNENGLVEKVYTSGSYYN